MQNVKNSTRLQNNTALYTNIQLLHVLITIRYSNNIKTDDDINASIIAECIKIRDDTMTCDEPV